MGVFSFLTPAEQGQLHDFFQLSKDLTPEQLSAHREQITRQRPSLPHQAGRALSHLNAEAAHWAADLQHQRVLAGKGSNTRQHNITVRSVVRPEIGARKFADALIKIAREKLGSDGTKP
jgi:hypothetical protein